MSHMWARCNYDSKPVHPTDRLALETFRIFLRMDDEEKREAIRLDPQWQIYIFGSVEDYERARNANR
jgi:hypothetical protein